MPVSCRHCGGGNGELVLDLGRQPACDDFPAATADPAGDDLTPLRMWWCADCALAQLVEDPAVPEQALGVEPAAMREQALTVLDRIEALGLLDPAARVAEYGSPHGGSWADPLAARGLRLADPESEVDVVLDVYGLLHEPDQAAALRARAARLARRGALVCQLHPLGTMLRHGQWNDLRHGHFAYWSLPALADALDQHDLGVHRAWLDPMAGGTAVVVATRDPDPDAATATVFRAEVASGVRDVAAIRALGDRADADAVRLRDWLAAESDAGRTVLGYGAASRSVPLLNHAGIDAGLLPAIGDASPRKQGLRVPGTDIPVITPGELTERRPDTVLLFLPDLLTEVRRSVPGVEAAGGRWLVAADLAPVS